MEMDELESGPEITPAEYAEELCREEACFARVPELEDIEDDQEVSEWCRFLRGLDDVDSEEINIWESVCAVPGLGWIEDEYGSAVFAQYC